MMRLTYVAAVVIAGHAAAFADSVPRYDVEPGCRSVARAAGQPIKDAQECIKEELRLRDQLVAEWSNFHAADRARCLHRLEGAWRPTYVELITCLELAREVRRLPEQLSPSGVTMAR